LDVHHLRKIQQVFLCQCLAKEIAQCSSCLIEMSMALVNLVKVDISPMTLRSEPIHIKCMWVHLIPWHQWWALNAVLYVTLTKRLLRMLLQIVVHWPTDHSCSSTMMSCITLHLLMMILRDTLILQHWNWMAKQPIRTTTFLFLKNFLLIFQYLLLNYQILIWDMKNTLQMLVAPLGLDHGLRKTKTSKTLSKDLFLYIILRILQLQTIQFPTILPSSAIIVMIDHIWIHIFNLTLSTKLSWTMQSLCQPLHGMTGESIS